MTISTQAPLRRPISNIPGPSHDQLGAAQPPYRSLIVERRFG
jgi:hypothetical protein